MNARHHTSGEKQSPTYLCPTPINMVRVTTICTAHIDREVCCDALAGCVHKYATRRTAITPANTQRPHLHQQWDLDARFAQLSTHSHLDQHKGPLHQQSELATASTPPVALCGLKKTLRRREAALFSVPATISVNDPICVLVTCSAKKMSQEPVM